MQELWTLLGHDRIAEQLLEYFRTDPSHRLALVEGTPGAGKSTFARGVAAAWREGGGTVALLEGDDLNERRELYPFQRGLSALDQGWSAMTNVASIVPKILDAAAGTGGLASLAVEGATRLKSAARGSRLLFIGKEQQRILADLERISANKTLLLVADNIHWWDVTSLLLLLDMLSSEAAVAYPFLGRMRVVAVRTNENDQPAIHADCLNQVLRRLKPQKWQLPTISKEDFPTVLRALSGTHSDEEVGVVESLSDFLFLLSNGHLALAWKAAEHLLDAPDKASLLSELDEAAFLREIFEERLRAQGAFGDQGLKLLEMAAVIGLTFRNDELSCLADQKLDALLPVLGLGAKGGIIELRGEQGHFRHDYFRRYFRRRLADRSTALHAKLAECLRQFRPGDYLSRYRAHELGGSPRAGLPMLALHMSQNVRQGLAWDRNLTMDERRDIEEGELARFATGWKNAWTLMSRYEFAACLDVLDRLPAGIVRPLQAEADFLRASCLLATRKEDDRRAAHGLLLEWMDYWIEEPELGVRIALLYLYALTHVATADEIQKTERQIIRFLSARLDYDPSARDQIFRLQRCASSLCDPELAVHRVAEAVEHFAPAPGMSIARDPLEYYRALNNHVALLITVTRYDEAVAQHARLSELIDTYGEDFFPRFEYPANNGILAAYRAGRLDARSAFMTMFDLVHRLGSAPDPYYLKNSLAVYAMLAGEIDHAGAIFETLLKRLDEPGLEQLEPNMVYLIKSNFAGYLNLTGQPIEGLELWDSLAPLVDRIPYTAKAYFKRKQALMRGAFEAVPAGDAVGWDRFLIDMPTREVGACWDNFGRGFRMPEIEFWRDA